MRTLLFVLILTGNLFDSQTIKGIITDSLDNQPITFANVLLLNGKGIYSDEKGSYNLTLSNQNYKDTLKISAYGYNSFYYPLINFENKNELNFNVKLSPKIKNIEEVFISNKINYNRKIVIGEDRLGNIGVTSLIGYETCVYIENTEQTKGKLKTVFIDLKKRRNAELTSFFKIKFYEYDEKNDMPGNELAEKSIEAIPKNSKYRLKIDLEKLNISFPKKGICIGVEMVYPENKSNKYTKFGPAFRYTLSNNRKSITWSNYHNKGWKKSEFKAPNLKTKILEFSNPMIGIEVLYPTKNK